MRSLERRMRKLEGGNRKVTQKQREEWFTRALNDPDWLEEQIILNPGPPGSQLAEVNAQLLELMPWMKAGGLNVGARAVPQVPTP